MAASIPVRRANPQRAGQPVTLVFRAADVELWTMIDVWRTSRHREQQLH
jgi:hypothetical protein